MLAIDIHAHAMPLPLLSWLEGRGLADLSDVDLEAESGVVRLDPQVSGVAAGAPLPLARSQWDTSARLRDMDAQGVTHQAVSLPPFLFCSNAPDRDLVTEVVARGNDELAALVAEASDRLIALGSVPIGTAAAAAEATRAFGLGMAGVAVGSRGAGLELDNSINEPLWELLAAGDRLAFLHPSGVPDASRVGDYYLPQLLGYPMETAIAVTRLVFSGVRERHRFPLVLAHGGGCLPWLRGRLDLGWERKDVARSTLRPPSVAMADFYYDTAVFSRPLLQHLVDDLGSDHVVIGTDFPFELADREPLRSVSALNLDAAARADIRWRTAARLLGVDAGQKGKDA